MDYHALQETLFQLDPTDPKEDLAKLQAQAGGSAEPSDPAPQEITESIEVPEGSLPVGTDSVSDFAALAGVKLTEAPQTQQNQQKTGQGAKMVGNKLGAKGSAGMMGKALDKVSQGGALPSNLAKQIAPFAKSLETILGDPQLRNKFMALIKQAERAEKQSAPEQPQENTVTSIRNELHDKLKEFKLKN